MMVVRFAQYYLDCLSQASYLIADERSGLAAVVDPRRDVQAYLDDDVSDLIGGYAAWNAAPHTAA
jgi:hypothetical protein